MGVFQVKFLNFCKKRIKWFAFCELDHKYFDDFALRFGGIALFFFSLFFGVGQGIVGVVFGED